MTQPLTIGLTGGIGSGKSKVCELFAKFGIPIIDTDQIAREVVQPNSTGLREITKQLGKQYITEQGELNRSKLRETIFKEPQKKQILESILHPLIRQNMLSKISHFKQATESTYPFILVAIPLLIEGIKNNQKPDYLDEIWVVDCSEQTQLERASQRDQQKRQDIEAIMNQQASRDQRLKWADRVIENETGLLELEQQIAQVMQTFKQN